VVSHFALADLAAFSDFEKLKCCFDSIRRTYITLSRSLIIQLWDEQRHSHEIEVVLRDSMLLAPASKRALAEIGKLVGVEKVELREGQIESMDELLVDDPDRFQDYALTDPKIAVLYCIKMMELNFEITGRKEIPPTLSSIGVTY